MKIKHTALALATTLFATGAVLAQAPAGVTNRPPAELAPTQAGGAAQAKGEMNANTKGANVGTLGLTSGAAVGVTAGGTRPPAELAPAQAGGAAQAKGEMNANSRGANAGTLAGTATVGYAVGMDANGDGWISRKEWNDHHDRMWGGMKADKKGNVAWADVQARMGHGTPK